MGRGNLQIGHEKDCPSNLARRKQSLSTSYLTETPDREIALIRSDLSYPSTPVNQVHLHSHPRAFLLRTRPSVSVSPFIFYHTSTVFQTEVRFLYEGSYICLSGEKRLYDFFSSSRKVFLC